MSGSLGKSENQSGQSFNQDVWGGQQPALQDLYGAAAGLFNMGKGDYSRQMQQGQQLQGGTVDAMQQPWQQQMGGGAYGGMDLTGQMNQSIGDIRDYQTQTGGLYADIMGGAGNDYADAMRGQLTSDAEKTLGMNLGALDQRAAAAGMSGGSRHGTATGQIADDINTNLQQNLTGLGYDTFDQDLQNKLNIAQMADTNRLSALTQNQNTIGGMMGGYNQAAQGGLNYGGNMFGYGSQMQQQPWQNLGMYSNVIGAPTMLGSGSGSSSGKGKSTSGGL